MKSNEGGLGVFGNYWYMKGILYWILAGLRVVLTLVPQTGYIHPDEFFQSVEVIAGDRFDIEVHRPWEFNASFPIRSTLIPQVIVGLPYTILNILSPYSSYYLQIHLKSPYLLVVLPRLFACALSFLNDYSIYKICCIYRRNYRFRLVIFASSFVMLTYATRTFSNTMELLLNSILIYYVSRCMACSEKIVLQSDHWSERYEKAPTIVERVKYYKLRASLPSHSLNHCLVLATVTVLGIFNRPTFVAFAFPPIAFWLQRGLGSRSVGFWDFHVRIITFIICGIPTAAAIIITDSFYFGYLTLSEIMKFEIGMNNFVVTPLNFLRYNSVNENLAQHGIHGRYQHFLVNVPLLFNVLGVVGLISFLKIINMISNRHWLQLPRIQSIESLMTACFIIPIALLSIFPHQEPRFIIPVLLPLVFLNGGFFGNEGSLRTVVDPSITRREPSRIKWQVIWWIFNIALTIFYGFLHQGGVLPLASHFSHELKAKPELTHIHLFTSYTYSLPTAFLQLKNTKKIYTSSTKHRYQLKQDFFLYEEGSKDLPEVYADIRRTLTDCEKKHRNQKIPYRLYYAMPVNLFPQFIEHILINGTRDLSYQTTGVFYPHVSTENLPRFSVHFDCFLVESLSLCLNHLTTNFSSDLVNLLQNFGLLLLRIEVPDNVGYIS
ncbi:GPI mannosyltransferase 4 [Fopius arisanus]|uniref:Mannosyltransferase n=1 Tax=Fopius arisanus TaxID=64838 RepID=A0A9R1TKH9_9HYME|nr:PREDICTED: GPI mannosyltransferase 4 [Fopius arisanus]